MLYYEIFLFVHSWVRWLILLLAFVVVARSYAGWLGGQHYGKSDNAMSGSLIGLFHLQLLLGLILYFVSPWVNQAWEMGMGNAMKDSSVRFWAVEHIAINVIAVVVAQVGRSRTRRIADSVKKYKTQAIFYSIALVLILSRIPWSEAARLVRTNIGG